MKINASPNLPILMIAPSSPDQKSSLLHMGDVGAGAHAELVGQTGADRMTGRLEARAGDDLLLLELAEAVFQPRRPAAGDHRLDARPDREAVEGRVARGEQAPAACQRCRGTG